MKFGSWCDTPSAENDRWPLISGAIFESYNLALDRTLRMVTNWRKWTFDGGKVFEKAEIMVSRRLMWEDGRRIIAHWKINNENKKGADDSDRSVASFCPTRVFRCGDGGRDLAGISANSGTSVIYIGAGDNNTQQHTKKNIGVCNGIQLVHHHQDNS